MKHISILYMGLYKYKYYEYVFFILLSKCLFIFLYHSIFAIVKTLKRLSQISRGKFFDCLFVSLKKYIFLGTFDLSGVRKLFLF